MKRTDALFAIERVINGRDAAERLRVRQEQSAPLLADLEAWLRQERQRLSRSAAVTQPIDYMLRRWERFTGFLDDVQICLSNNAAERALRGFPLGRKAWLFAGSERGADHAAAMVTLINIVKLNDIDPQAWLADVLARIAGHPARRLLELLPWEWNVPRLRSRKPPEAMAAVTRVFTLSRAARMLERDEELLWDLAGQLEPEDGVLWIYCVDKDDGIMAFTGFGLNNLKEIIADQVDPKD